MYSLVWPSQPSIQPDTNPVTAPIPSFSYSLRRRRFQDQRNHPTPSIKITNYTSRNLFFEERNTCGSETVIFLHELYGCHLEFKWVELTGTGNGNEGGCFGSGFGINDDKDAWGLSVGNGYHVLIPDLPGHSLSRELLWSHPGDFDKRENESGYAQTTNPSLLRITCDHLNDLIRQHAKRQRAHLVGIGYGAYIALQMAKLFPASVSCVIAISTSSLSPTSTPTVNPTPLKRNLSFFTPYLSYASLKPILTIPKLYQWIIEEGRTNNASTGLNSGEKRSERMERGKLHKGAKLPDGLTEEMWANTRLELAKKVYHSLKREFDLGSVIQAIITSNNSENGFAGWVDRGYWRTNANGNGGGMNLDWYGSKKRTLLVVGNDEEWAELNKSKDFGSLLADTFKDKKNEGRFMITTRGVVHAWNLHEPEVFARMVEGWIQNGEDGLPSELVGWKAWAD